jgi:hypothetical protein
MSMKKKAKIISVSLLLLAMLVFSFGQAFAIPAPVLVVNNFTDPVVTPLKTSYTYTSEVVGVGYLKGATQAENQLMVPIGRTDEQFGSNGLVLGGLTGKEKVKACFEFRGYQYKWAGSIFKWNGTKWVKQATTFTDDPAGTTNACATNLGNGTYALIIYYWGPQEMVVPTLELT